MKKKIESNVDHLTPELKPHEDHFVDPWWKRPLVLIIGIALILLMISSVVVWSVGDIVSGQIESVPLVGTVLEVGEFNLVFLNDTNILLQQMYHQEQEKEFAVCLAGIRQDGDYYIDSLYVPTMYEQRFEHVRFEPCDSDTLVLLHTHPYKSCLASDTDLNTLEEMKKQKADVLMVVMCEPGRFSVYS